MICSLSSGVCLRAPVFAEIARANSSLTCDVIDRLRHNADVLALDSSVGSMRLALHALAIAYECNASASVSVEQHLNGFRRIRVDVEIKQHFAVFSITVNRQ